MNFRHNSPKSNDLIYCACGKDVSKHNITVSFSSTQFFFANCLLCSNHKITAEVKLKNNCFVEGANNQKVECNHMKLYYGAVK